MSKELGLLTPIEKELHFNVWCKENGVARFLLDLDDTICATRQVFRVCMNTAFDYLGVNVPEVSRDGWQKLIEETNNKLFEQIAVNPNRWGILVDELAKSHGLSTKIQEDTKQIFAQIYLTPPTMMKGVDEGLGFLTKVGIPVGIVTHADPEWTWRKFNWLDLKRFVKWDDIFVVDQNKHKTSESWQQAIEYFHLKPEQCAVVGDSPRSDINPAWSIGVRQCFLVKDPNQWSVHNQSVNESVREIENLSQIVNVISEGD